MTSLCQEYLGSERRELSDPSHLGPRCLRRGHLNHDTLSTHTIRQFSLLSRRQVIRNRTTSRKHGLTLSQGLAHRLLAKW